jgi:DtxR family Mn-dependent transcriptional regulator
MFNFLTNVLGIDSNTADEDACKMEHAVSPVTLKRLVQFMEFMEACPRVGPDWLQYFNEYCEAGSSKDVCIRHMKEFLEEYTDKIREMEQNDGDG